MRLLQFVCTCLCERFFSIHKVSMLLEWMNEWENFHDSWYFQRCLLVKAKFEPIQRKERDLKLIALLVLIFRAWGQSPARRTLHWQRANIPTVPVIILVSRLLYRTWKRILVVTFRDAGQFDSDWRFAYSQTYAQKLNIKDVWGGRESK